MRLITFGELETKVRLDLDMQDTDFITYDEMAGYANEAIADAEAEILKISEDYFLKPASPNLSLVNGESAVVLPTDIYAQKIRNLLYVNGNLIYPVKRLRGMPDKFVEAANITQYAAANFEYRYFLEFPTAGEQGKILLFPAAQESGAYLQLWYLRTANRVPLTTESAITRSIQQATVVDIPEGGNYIMQFMKCRCMEKDLDPRLEGGMQILQNFKKIMIDTLTQQVPDNDDLVEMDFTAYSEQS